MLILLLISINYIFFLNFSSKSSRKLFDLCSRLVRVAGSKTF